MKITEFTPNTAILKELGSRMRRIRRQQKISQGRLATKAGLGVATLRRLEDGKDGQLGSWIKILKALQIVSALDELLPESFDSPMAEALSQIRSRRRPDSTPTGKIWGDEQK